MMRDRDLARELDLAIGNVDDAVRRQLECLGIPGELLRARSMVGIDRVRRAGPYLYEPSETGAAMYVTPVLVDDVWSPEALDPIMTARRDGNLIDLMAPRR